MIACCTGLWFHVAVADLVVLSREEEDEGRFEVDAVGARGEQLAAELLESDGADVKAEWVRPPSPSLLLPLPMSLLYTPSVDKSFNLPWRAGAGAAARPLRGGRAGILGAHASLC